MYVCNPGDIYQVLVFVLLSAFGIDPFQVLHQILTRSSCRFSRLLRRIGNQNIFTDKDILPSNQGIVILIKQKTSLQRSKYFFQSIKLHLHLFRVSSLSQYLFVTPPTLLQTVPIKKEKWIRKTLFSRYVMERTFVSII